MVTSSVAGGDQCLTGQEPLHPRSGARPGLHGHMERQMRSELRYVTDLPVAELRRTADQIAERRRLLDTEIQAANWATDLLEERPTGSDSR